MMKRSHYLTTTLAVLSLASAAPAANATSIAIVDSGTDLTHPDLVDHQWTNLADPDDAVDNDDNGYIDDTHGWNFADNNNKLYNKKLVGKFSKDVYDFFGVQARMLLGRATDEDKQWLDTKRNDPKFIEELGKFGNWIHGTHVAGIASRDADEARIMVLKLIGGTSVQSLAADFIGSQPIDLQDAGMKDKLLRAMLAKLGAAQGEGFTSMGLYLRNQKARVANCSFGSSATQLRQLLGPVVEKVLGRKLSDEEMNEYIHVFMDSAIASVKKNFTDASKNTLFVIAAGNDGADNDVLPTVPANIKGPNTITVAATMGVTRLASFSNYGAAMVDIAAPGVGIRSSIPGEDHLLLSGTSQAAPYVTNVVGRIWDANPALTMEDVRAILFGTVDFKPFLLGKVKTGGIANVFRAVRAAELSVTMGSVYAAIEKARDEVSDVRGSAPGIMVDESETYVTPMPSFIH